MVMVEDPENVRALLTNRDPQHVLEDYLDGMMDRFSDDYRFSNVSRGEPSFSTNGIVREDDDSVSRAPSERHTIQFSSGSIYGCSPVPIHLRKKAHRRAIASRVRSQPRMKS